MPETSAEPETRRRRPDEAILVSALQKVIFQTEASRQTSGVDHLKPVVMVLRANKLECLALASLYNQVRQA
jgi:hypothetical protein